MSNENENRSILFGVIPPARRKPEQLARWQNGEELPTYKLLRDPFSLDELMEYNYHMAIWRDNETLTYVKPRGTIACPVVDASRRSLSVGYYSQNGQGISLQIVGKTDNAVATTAAYFMKLEQVATKGPSFHIGSCHNRFDFRATEFLCLSHMFDVSRSLEVHFFGLTLSATLSTVLATRSLPTQLHLDCCQFEDGGTAFVGALENRQSSFGSLIFDISAPITDDNMKRLLQVQVIDSLNLTLWDKKELALLAFSAKVDSLEYAMSWSSLSVADIHSLNIAAKNLLLDIHYESENETFPTETALCFLRRLGEIGHFIELKVDFIHDDGYGDEPPIPVPDCIVQELITSALANPHLKVLVLDDESGWGAHLETLFNGLKDHKGLCTIKVDVDDAAFGPNLSYLRQLLSHNRFITVTSCTGQICSDGSSIDELYALNAFYRGSANLAVGSPSDRPSLVATALTKTASFDFQRSALLLSKHADALYELVQFACWIDGENPTLQTTQVVTLKRSWEQWETNVKTE